MNNEDLLTELRWALDNIGASRDYFRIGNALESAIKALTPSATAAPGTEPRGCPTPGACSCPAARAEETAPDRPDWAQQLPGAEMFDRAARYEYVRKLSPRQFAALYDEALHGDRFDDLVDRYRDAGEKPE